MAKMYAPNNEGLQPFIEKLDKSYYDEINALCTTAKKQAVRLLELETHQNTPQYVTLCSKLVDDIQHYIKAKKDNLVPYVKSLIDKQGEGHDCRQCTGTGNCNVTHEMQLGELAQSHSHLRDIINRLQMMALPLYSETIYPDAYRVLRNHMALLDNSLTELLYLEETYLPGKVIEAQKNIHAGS